MMFLLAPPLCCAGNLAKRREGRVPHNAKQVVVGISRMELSFGRRTIENHAGKIFSRRGADLLHELTEQLFVSFRIMSHNNLSSPTAAGATATRHTAAESAKAPATTPAAASSATQAAPAPTATTSPATYK